MNIHSFVDREEELKFLNNQNQQRPSFVVLYGRRRVGKTELVEQFCRNKKHIYYTAPQSNSKEQLKEAFDLVYEKTQDPHVNELKHSWETLLRYCKDKNLIFVLDEFPYIIKADKTVPSKIQRIWDKELRHSNIFLILTGSSVSMMEEKVLNRKAPLYGRRTGQWKLEPFNFKEMQLFFPNYSYEDKIKTYSILGGIPYFLQQFDPKKSVTRNIYDKILNKGSVLHNEVEFLMREELREPHNYFTILTSISQGNTKFSEIKNDTGIQKNALTSYISTLRNLHLVKRRVPITEKESKKGRYYIQDNFFRFWFKFVFPNRSQMETDKKTLLEQIKKSLPVFVSYTFEDVCRELTSAEFNGFNVGKWWYKNEEIDIIGLNENKDSILFGECKWSKNKVDSSLLFNLENKKENVRWKNKKRKEIFILFSKNGFTKGLHNEANKRRDVFLYDLENIMESFSELLKKG
ncbi:MAG: ATP-binding protein [Candidatus Thermoplasmatota archaeon]